MRHFVHLFSVLFLITLGAVGCSSGYNALGEVQEVLQGRPIDLRIKFNGLTYDLCWDYDPQAAVVYNVYYFPDKDSEGLLRAQVVTRRVPIALLRESGLSISRGYLAVQAMTEGGGESELSDLIQLQLDTVETLEEEHNVPEQIIMVNLLRRAYNYDELLLVKSIQGIINRKYNMPKIYIIHRRAGADGNSVVDLTEGDVKWLKAAVDKLGASLVEVEPSELLEMYKDDLAGQVVYDKTRTESVIPTDVKHYWTVPLAVTYAGLHDAVVVSEEIPGLPVLFDFRDKDWTKLEAYEWVIKELVPKVNKDLVFLNDAYTPYNIDFAIDKQALYMDLNSMEGSPERDVALKILKMFPRITPVFAWTEKYTPVDGTNEYRTVKLIDQSGHTLIPDVGACATNFSFHTRVPARNPIAQHVKYIEYEDDKYYVTFIYSDGDAIGYINTHLYQAWHWNNKGRGEVPIGWQISPYLGTIVPHITETYYNEATPNDEFVMGINGYGYSLPGRLNRLGYLDEYLYKVEELLPVMDYKTTCIVDYEPTMDSIDAWIGEYAKKTELNALFIEGGAIDERIGPVASPLYDRTGPVQRIFKRGDGGYLSTFVMWHRGRFVHGDAAVAFGADRNDNVVGAIESIVQDPMKTTKFIYVYVFVYFMNPSQIAEAASMLPGGVIPVKPSEFANLFLEHNFGKGEVTNEITVENVNVYRGSKEENAVFVSVELGDMPRNVEVLYGLGSSEELFTRRLKNIGGMRYAIAIPEWTNAGYTMVTPVMLRIRDMNGGITVKDLNI